MYDFYYIKEMFAEKGIAAYFVECSFDVINDSILFINYEEFLEFINSHEIKDVFVYEHYLEIEDYLITEKTFKKIEVQSHAYECIFDDIEEYNDSLLKEDINFPKFVFSIFIWNNQRFYFVFQNKIMFNGEQLISAEEKLIELLENNKEFIREESKIKKQKRENELKKLKKEILNDPKFKKCTNIRLRRNYIYSYFGENCQYSLLKQHWANENGILFHGAFDFIEMLWKEVKG